MRPSGTARLLLLYREGKNRSEAVDMQRKAVQVLSFSRFATLAGLRDGKSEIRNVLNGGFRRALPMWRLGRAPHRRIPGSSQQNDVISLPFPSLLLRLSRIAFMHRNILRERPGELPQKLLFPALPACEGPEGSP